MVLSRKNTIILFVIGFLFISFAFLQPIAPIYGGTQTGNLTLRSSNTLQETDYTLQLDFYQIDDADPENDYYYIEYHFEDMKYGADSAINPCYIEIEIFVTSLSTNESTLGLLLSYRNPAAGWIATNGLIGASAGCIFFQSGEENGSAWARWNISGAGVWPLLIYVADDDFTASLGFRVGEMEGISIEASCSIKWAFIDRFLGLTQYVDQISLPAAGVTYEP